MQQSVCGLTTDRCFDLYDHEIQTIADWALISAADPSWCLEEDNYNPGWARPGVVQADGNRSKVSCSWCQARWWWCRQLELIFHWLEIFHHVRVSQLSQSYLFNYQHQETLPPPPLQMAHDYTAFNEQQLSTGVSSKQRSLMLCFIDRWTLITGQNKCYPWNNLSHDFINIFNRLCC